MQTDAPALLDTARRTALTHDLLAPLPAAVDKSTKDVGIKNQASEDVNSVLEQLRSVSTATVRDLSRPVVSPHPSVQGPWDPSTSFDSFSLRIAQPGGAAQLK